MSTEEQECQPELLAEQWGARLSTARENKALSIEQVAADLNLPSDYIVSLEQGNLEGLPSMVFARGYIRAYAKLLHLDDNQLVAEFEQLHGQCSTGNIKPVSKVREQVKVNDPVMKFSTWLFILAIVGVTVWWWQTQYGGVLELTSSNGDVSSSTEKIESSDVATGTSPVVEMENGTAKLVLPTLDDAPVSDTAEQQVEDTEDRSQAENESEPQYLSQAEINKLQQAIDDNNPEEHNQSDESVQPAPSEVPSASAELVATNVSITAEFVAECWVSIKDAEGKTLFNNLRGKGQSLDVSGKAPVSILLGAADAVSRFSVNGADLDLEKHSRKNVVRISLPIEE